jgi:hypothetical protein
LGEAVARYALLPDSPEFAKDRVMSRGGNDSQSSPGRRIWVEELNSFRVSLDETTFYGPVAWLKLVTLRFLLLIDGTTNQHYPSRHTKKVFFFLHTFFIE